VVTLDLDHAVSDRPAAAAALFELTRELLELRLGQRQAGDDADALAAASLGLTADPHPGGAAARTRCNDGAGRSLAFGIDVHARSLGDAAARQIGSRMPA
jgi:hypothetical protein